MATRKQESEKIFFKKPTFSPKNTEKNTVSRFELHKDEWKEK